MLYNIFYRYRQDFTRGLPFLCLKILRSSRVKRYARQGWYPYARQHLTLDERNTSGLLSCMLKCTAHVGSSVCLMYTPTLHDMYTRPYAIHKL